MLPNVEAFEAERVNGHVRLTIWFSRGFSDIEDARTKENVVKALWGPKGDAVTRANIPQFGDSHVEMCFPSIWAASAGLRRVFDLYVQA